MICFPDLLLYCQWTMVSDGALFSALLTPCWLGYSLTNVEPVGPMSVLSVVDIDTKPWWRWLRHRRKETQKGFTSESICVKIKMRQGHIPTHSNEGFIREKLICWKMLDNGWMGSSWPHLRGCITDHTDVALFSSQRRWCWLTALSSTFMLWGRKVWAPHHRSYTSLFVVR